MKIIDMVNAFEKEGFTVTKRYIPDNKAYRFNICKDGMSVEEQFTWMPNLSNEQNCGRQERFVKYLIRVWEEEYNSHYSLPKKMKKEYILHVNTWDGSHKKCDKQIYVVNDVTINDGFFSAGVVIPKIEDVIFNGPATIVKWSDGTKTVVKWCEDDLFDPEKGLAMAISKKALGDLKEVKKWTKKYEKYEKPDIVLDFKCGTMTTAEAVANLKNAAKHMINEVFGK